MLDRINMNTESMQKEFSKTYELFYWEHDLVLSGSNVTTWLLWISNIKLCQKVPTKNYCWVNVNKTWSISFGKVYSFAWIDFEIASYNSVNKQEKELIKLIKNFFKENDYEYWVDIEFLSENPRWHGFGFSWVSWALLACALFVLVWKIELEVFDSYESFVKTDVFEEIHRLARKFDYISKYGESIGSNSYFAMLNSDLPMLYFTSKYEDSDIKDNIDNIDKIDKYAFRLKDFLWIKSWLTELPLDYGIIFSWTKNKAEQIVNIYNNYLDELNDSKTNISQLLQKNWVTNFKWFDFWANLDTKLDYKDTKDLIYSKFWYIQILFNILNSFKDLLKKWYDEEVTDNFLFTMKMNSNFYGLLERENEVVSIIKDLFCKFKKTLDEDIVIFPVNSGKLWWSYVFVTKFNKSRQTLKKVFEELDRLWYDKIWLEYSSWLDGTTSDWIVLNQYISKWIFSKYVSKNNVLYTSNYGEVYIWDYNSIVEKEWNHVLLDTINKKIYLKWSKLTSKDLVSQSTTIEVLQMAIENLWEELTNKDLSVSSYTKNKNEMLWKIVLPFIELINKEFWEKLPFVCKWSHTEFYLKLDKFDTKIWIIKKIR